MLGLPREETWFHGHTERFFKKDKSFRNVQRCWNAQQIKMRSSRIQPHYTESMCISQRMIWLSLLRNNRAIKWKNMASHIQAFSRCHKQWLKILRLSMLHKHWLRAVMEMKEFWMQITSLSCKWYPIACCLLVPVPDKKRNWPQHFYDGHVTDRNTFMMDM